MVDRYLFEDRKARPGAFAFAWIFRVEPGVDLRVVLLNDFLEEMLSHWLGGRTVPHVPVWQHCAGCERGWVPYSRWYGSCWVPAAGKQGLVELTEHAIRTCPQLVDDKPQLRGRKLQLTRMGLHRNSKIRAVLSEERMPEAMLPPPWDVGQALSRIFANINGRQRGET